MMKAIRKSSLGKIDLLSLTLLAGILPGLAVSGAASGSLRSILIPAQSIPTEVSHQADCLWLQARNHGFYGIQHQAVTGKATASEEELWQVFLDSTGEHECGSPLTELTELVPALLASLPEADRHFMSQTSESGVFQRSVK